MPRVPEPIHCTAPPRACLTTIEYGETYNLVVDPEGLAAIECKLCGRLSYHPQDIANRYCGCCHKFHEEGLR